MIELVLLLILGFVAGIAAGLLGIGGGIIIVPGLIFIANLTDPDIALGVHAAVGTSLATIMFTGISSARGHHLKGGINYEIFYKLTLGLMLGALVGAAIAISMNARMLTYVVVIFLLFVGTRLFFQKYNFKLSMKKSFAHLAMHGSWIGMLSSMLGIGGGTFIVPLLNAKGIQIRQSIGTSAMCGIPIAIFGCIGFIYFGKDGTSGEYIHWESAFVMALSSIVGARHGVRLVYKIDQKYLKKIFGIFICIAAALLLIR
jgi:uncharacterized membrane protein YfcA